MPSSVSPSSISTALVLSTRCVAISAIVSASAYSSMTELVLDVGTKILESIGRTTPRDTKPSRSTSRVFSIIDLNQTVSNHLICSPIISLLNICDVIVRLSPRSVLIPIALEINCSISFLIFSEIGSNVISPVSGSITFRSLTKTAASILAIMLEGVVTVSNLRLTS